MGIEIALVLVDEVILANTGKHLSNLETIIIQSVWQGKKYLDIADEYGCTEGHTKDIASYLWKQLSQAWGEKITKSNFRAVVERRSPKDIAINEEVNFLGRSQAITSINNLFVRGSKIILIQGEGGIGKTTLAQQYLRSGQFELILELLMAKETANIVPVESVVQEWLKKDFQEDPALAFGVSLARLKHHLLQKKVGILIDNLEPALDKEGKLVAPHRNYLELLRILGDRTLKCFTLITSRDRFCEADVNFQRYRLSGLDEETWQKFFNFYQINSDLSSLKMLHKTYGGNAKAMGIICGSIREDFASNLQIYWQVNQNDPLVETDLKNLVASQFNRLQNLDPDAYKLLYRLGCYRYQDIPSLPTEALLTLLWDVDLDKRRGIIESLKNRSLIEFFQGKYWLHPVIKAEAINRLKLHGEIQIVHEKIAEFWTETVKTIATVTDAFMALEAYYHYLTISDYERAAQVILKSRNNQWQQFLPLGSTFYRLGLLQPIEQAIAQIIDKINSLYFQSELYNIIGDLSWIRGKVNQAIAYQEKTLNLVTNLQVNTEERQTLYYLKMLQVDSLLSIGLYKIDLWELTEAANFFQQVIALSEGTQHHAWAEKSHLCLALVQSYLGLITEVNPVLEKIYLTAISGKQTGRFAYFMQIFAQTYLNLGQWECAQKIFQQTITFATASHYTQIKAKAYLGLAIIARKKINLPLSIDYHLEAIKLLQEMGAQCDLAQAYFELSLTYQQMKESYLAQENFVQAITIFEQIHAPKQIEKIWRISQQENFG